MKIIIQTNTGKSYTINNLSPSDLIKSIKLQIQEYFPDLNIKQHKLYFNTKELIDTKTLESYKIKNESILNLGTVQGNIELTFQTLTKRTITVNVENTNIYIYEVKSKIMKQEGIPALQQRLIFGGKQMEDMKLLCDYYIEADHIIYLFLMPQVTCGHLQKIEAYCPKSKLLLCRGCVLGEYDYVSSDIIFNQYSTKCNNLLDMANAIKNNYIYINEIQCEINKRIEESFDNIFTKINSMKERFKSAIYTKIGIGEQDTKQHIQKVDEIINQLQKELAKLHDIQHAFNKEEVLTSMDYFILPKINSQITNMKESSEGAVQSASAIRYFELVENKENYNLVPALLKLHLDCNNCQCKDKHVFTKFRSCRDKCQLKLCSNCLLTFIRSNESKLCCPWCGNPISAMDIGNINQQLGPNSDLIQIKCVKIQKKTLLAKIKQGISFRLPFQYNNRDTSHFPLNDVTPYHDNFPNNSIVPREIEGVISKECIFCSTEVPIEKTYYLTCNCYACKGCLLSYIKQKNDMQAKLWNLVCPKCSVEIEYLILDSVNRALASQISLRSIIQ